MGKRKKSSRNAGPKKKNLLKKQFPCLFCNHQESVSPKLDRRAGIGQLNCTICGQSFTTSIHPLSEGVDVYADWIDACDEAEAGVGNENADEPPEERYQGTMAQSKAHRREETEDQYEDDFVVNDEEGMENDYIADD